MSGRNCSIAEEKENRIARLKEETRESIPQKQQVELYYDQLNAAHDRLQNGGVETVSAFKVQGWVRKDRAQRVEQVVQGVTDAYQLTFADPEEGEIPPTVLENGRLVEPYESVVELYSLPKAGSVDPDMIMAPFHFIFFGMMMSDAGYGLVLTIMLYFALKKFSPRALPGSWPWSSSLAVFPPPFGAPCSVAGSVWNGILCCSYL